MLMHYAQQLLCFSLGQRRKGKTYGIHLVGPDTAIRQLSRTDYVMQVTIRVHKLLSEFVPKIFGVLDIMGDRKTQLLTKINIDAKGIVPQGIDFDRTPHSWRHNMALHFSIHPRELYARLSPIQQSFRSDMNSISCSFAVLIQDLSELRIYTLYKICILEFFIVLVQCYKQPKRGIYSVVFRYFTPIRKPIGNHTCVQILYKGFQDGLCCIFFSRSNHQAPHGDHCIPAPICKPGITGNQGLTVR